MDFNFDTGLLSDVTSIAPTGNTVAFSGTGGIVSMMGTTSQRPTTPTTGTYRYNSDINDLELWNGTTWKALGGSNSILSYTISGWTLLSGNKYYADITHNLGTFSLSTTLWNASTNIQVLAEVAALTNNTLRVTITGNSTTVRCIIVGPGTFTASAASTIILRTLTYYATSMDSPNNSDWVLNSLAPAIADPSNPALLVRRFSDTVEQGVGFNITVPAGATTVTFRFKGRAATAPTATRLVQPKIYTRALPNNAPIGSWSAATSLTAISIPNNAYVQYSSQSLSIATLGLSVNTLYQVELSRGTTVSGGTNLSGNWLLSEVTIEFT